MPGRAVLACCLLLLLAACQNARIDSFVDGQGSGGRNQPLGPIVGTAWDEKHPFLSLSYESGPGTDNYWIVFPRAIRGIEVGVTGQQGPLYRIPLMQASGGDFDPELRNHRLWFKGALGGGFDSFSAVTPDTSEEISFALLGFSNASGQQALYGVVGERAQAPRRGVLHFNGGYLLSRRSDGRQQASFTGKAQIRIDFNEPVPVMALVLTTPPELPRLFGRRVGAIRLLAYRDPASGDFQSLSGDVEGVGAGATARLRLRRFALSGRLLENGEAAVALFRLADRSGNPIVVGGAATHPPDSWREDPAIVGALPR